MNQHNNPNSNPSSQEPLEAIIREAGTWFEDDVQQAQHENLEKLEMQKKNLGEAVVKQIQDEARREVEEKFLKKQQELENDFHKKERSLQEELERERKLRQTAEANAEKASKVAEKAEAAARAAAAAASNAPNASRNLWMGIAVGAVLAGIAGFAIGYLSGKGNCPQAQAIPAAPVVQPTIGPAGTQPTPVEVMQPTPVETPMVETPPVEPPMTVVEPPMVETPPVEPPMTVTTPMTATTTQPMLPPPPMTVTTPMTATTTQPMLPPPPMTTTQPMQPDMGLKLDNPF